MSSANHTSVASGRGGRAFALGPRRALLAAIVAAVLALVPIVSLSGVLSSGGTATGAHRWRPVRSSSAGGGLSRSVVASTSVPGSSVKYGGLPSWLPKPKMHVNRVLTASAAHPVLSIQGDAVEVDLSHGRVRATAVGPEVPEEGRFPVPATTPCTFVVTFSSASGTVPLDPAAFTFLDDHGHTHNPRVSAMDGGPAPRAVAPGKRVSLKLYDVLPTGDGGLAWAPEGRRTLVGWDYTVEID
jgi:hypothetical protein